MNETRCETVLELLPDFVGRRLSPTDAGLVEAHLGRCADCRQEAELVALLHASRPSAPEAMVARIERATHAGRRPLRRPWWGLAAASVAAAALGIGVIAKGSPSGDETEVPGMVAGAGETSIWVADDGLVAGAPELEGLSDEALLTLLEEMDSEPTGGAA